MELDLLYVGIVYFGFRRSQSFKNPDRAVLRRLADACGANDLADFFQPAMRMRMARLMFMRVLVGVAVPVRVGVGIRRAMAMLVIVAARLLLRMGMAMFCGFRFLFPELFPRQLFFTGGDHIKLGGTDAAAVHAGNFQTRVHAQGGYGLGEDLRRNSGVKQGAQKHIAADTGKAL